MISDRHFLVRLGGIRPELLAAELVAEHVAYLHRLHAEGRLLLCGPSDDGTAIIVLRCTSEEEATRISAEDPFAWAGVYRDRDIVAFTPATVENNFLLRGRA